MTAKWLCGWETESEIPSEATFCRAFKEFSEGELPQKIHEVMIRNHAKEKLFGHVSRDSTPIEAREKPKKKAKTAEDSKPKKRGRPKKGEKRKKTRRRLELQAQRSLDENLADLPKPCDVGTKRDSKGKKRSWVGYKLHIDSVDGDIPVSCVLTSASLHDSQVAIPLAQMTKDRIDNLYDLMDSAYDAPEIHSFSQELGHIPIIDHNKRRGEKIEFDPAKTIRYNERSGVERVNSNLKDNYLPSKIRVRGPMKVMTEIMFGIVVLTANQLYNLLI